MGFTKATSDYLDAGGIIKWITTPKTSSFTAVSGEGYLVDTTSAGITVTLPTSPSAGDEVTIVDYAGTADTNSIVITSSNNIKGSSDNFRINYEGGSISMVYTDSTKGWITYNAANEGVLALADVPPSNFSADYLVVAGGGGGGGSTTTNTQGGGGGAGGLRTSYGSTNGGGGAAESSLSLFVSTNYTVTVGSGGNGGTTGFGSDGNNSVFHTITATGGGGGGYPANNGRSGGSGGGGSYDSSGGIASSPTQGYRGGNVVEGWGSNFPATYKTGGGGGAAATGQDGTLSTGQGNGGSGLAVNILTTSNATTYSVGEISGSNVYFAGGGAGGSGTGSGAPTGGIGGGADNGNGYHGVGEPGIANTGGGGSSGNGAIPSTGGDGGSGVVIIRYPNLYTLYISSGLTGSTFTEGSDKVTVFTAGTGTISFA